MMASPKIASAFVRAKRAFGPALKDKTNPAFRSKYADLAACVDAVDDALLAEGIAVYQETFEDATGVMVETVFLHDSGETLRCGKLHVPAAKQDPQGYGSALTYARRYSLMTACGIAPEDDDGNAATKSAQVAATVSHRVSATEEAFKSLQPEEQDRMRKISAKVIAAMPNVSGAIDIIDSEDLDADHKAGLWHLLDSSTRSAIKRAQETMKARPFPSQTTSARG